MHSHRHDGPIDVAPIALHKSAQPMNTGVTAKVRQWIRSDLDGFLATETAWATTLKESGLHFEGRPYPVSLRPLILGFNDLSSLERGCSQVFLLLEKVLDLYRTHIEVRSFFDAYQTAESSTLAYPSYRPLIRICRFDCAWFGADHFKILETNTACPGGVIQNGLAIRLWRTVGGASRLISDLRLLEQPLAEDAHLFVKELVSVAHSMGIDDPSAAAVNLEGCYTNEVDWIVAGLRDVGVSATLCDARELRLRNGELYIGDQRVTLTYNKLDPLMLLDNPDVREYLQAMEQETVCSVNPLVAQLIGEDKSILALLSDPKYAGYFTADELEVIEHFIPWTRILDHGQSSDSGGVIADLPTYVAEHRASLVLKPTNLSRGEGVVIGEATTPSEWRDAVDAGLHGRYVVQEYVPLPMIDVPRADDASPTLMRFGLDCYLFGGRLVGFHSRASSDPVVNIGHGGRLLPVLLAESI